MSVCLSCDCWSCSSGDEAPCDISVRLVLLFCWCCASYPSPSRPLSFHSFSLPSTAELLYWNKYSRRPSFPFILCMRFCFYSEMARHTTTLEIAATVDFITGHNILCNAIQWISYQRYKLFLMKTVSLIKYYFEAKLNWKPYFRHICIDDQRAIINCIFTVTYW